MLTSKGMNEEDKRLAGISCGERCVIKYVASGSDMRRRFLDIGLIPGTAVTCLGASPFGDPRTYLVRGKMIAIRGQDAECIVIRG